MAGEALQRRAKSRDCATGCFSRLATLPTERSMERGETEREIWAPLLRRNAKRPGIGADSGSPLVAIQL